MPQPLEHVPRLLYQELPASLELKRLLLVLLPFRGLFHSFLPEALCLDEEVVALPAQLLGLVDGLGESAVVGQRCGGLEPLGLLLVLLPDIPCLVQKAPVLLPVGCGLPLLPARSKALQPVRLQAEPVGREGDSHLRRVRLHPGQDAHGLIRRRLLYPLRQRQFLGKGPAFLDGLQEQSALSQVLLDVPQRVRGHFLLPADRIGEQAQHAPPGRGPVPVAFPVGFHDGVEIRVELLAVLPALHPALHVHLVLEGAGPPFRILGRDVPHPEGERFIDSDLPRPLVRARGPLGESHVDFVVLEIALVERVHRIPVDDRRVRAVESAELAEIVGRAREPLEPRYLVGLLPGVYPLRIVVLGQRVGGLELEEAQIKGDAFLVIRRHVLPAGQLRLELLELAYPPLVHPPLVAVLPDLPLLVAEQVGLLFRVLVSRRIRDDFLHIRGLELYRPALEADRQVLHPQRQFLILLPALLAGIQVSPGVLELLRHYERVVLG